MATLSLSRTLSSSGPTPPRCHGTPEARWPDLHPGLRGYATDGPAGLSTKPRHHVVYLLVRPQHPQRVLDEASVVDLAQLGGPIDQAAVEEPLHGGAQ